MAATPLPVEAILEILVQGPPWIAGATRGIADEILIQRPEPEEWSVVELLAHLRASADVRGDQRIEQMLAEDEPTIRTMSPRSWPLISSYVELPFSESLAAFTAQRERLLRRLRSLNPDAWQRGATLTGLGTRRYETVHSEAEALARHEESHVMQIEQRAALLRVGR
jgi:hypothetical protein